MTKSPKVSIIVPVFNGERYLSQAIQSALAQTYKNTEIIIVNDGSTDGSSNQILPYLDLTNVRYIEQKNRGVAAARNSAIRNATGELIAFLDQDDLWLPKKLELQVAYLESHPEIPLVHANLSCIDSGGAGIEFPWDTNVEGLCFRELFAANRIAILTVLVRKDCLDSVGLLNEDLPGVDDYELWLRISRRFPIGHMDEIVAHYRFHDRNVSGDLFDMTLWDLAAIQSFVAAFPEVYQTLGTRVVKLRLAQLHFELGEWYRWKWRNLHTARGHFGSAILLRPTHFASYRMFMWCCLSQNQHRTLSWYWHRMKTIPARANERGVRERH